MGTCTDAERRLIEVHVKPPAGHDGAGGSAWAKAQREALADVVMERIHPELMEKLYRTETARLVGQRDHDDIWNQLHAIGVEGRELVSAIYKKAEDEAARRIAERKGT